MILPMRRIKADRMDAFCESGQSGHCRSDFSPTSVRQLSVRRLVLVEGEKAVRHHPIELASSSSSTSPLSIKPGDAVDQPMATVAPSAGETAGETSALGQKYKQNFHAFVRDW